MKLVSLLSPRRIIPDVKAATQWEVMDELVGHLVADGDLAGEKKDGVLAALHEREEQVSTGIGHGVAIPHAYCSHIDQVTAIFGRSQEGIEFESCDNAPVHYLVMMIVPQDQSQAHLQTLAAIAGLFSRHEVRDRLKDAATSDEIYEVLMDCEG
jgi:mannitol/fructose-specific phosphotransferase system IIA component (Ntr-type)